MKRVLFLTAISALALLIAFAAGFRVWEKEPEQAQLKIGFVFEGDESSPETYNMSLAGNALTREWGDRVQLLVRRNVLITEAAEPLRELVRRGCALIFTNSHSAQVSEVAAEFPDVEFCQLSCYSTDTDALPENMHTFNGKLYQARYVSGVAAGLKLKELIDSGELKAEEAVVGFVAAYEGAESISGYTAFLMGVRSVGPQTVMRVRYVGGWSNYSKDRSCAAALINEGCVIIAHDTHTIGSAMACEEAYNQRKVYHVGNDQSMLYVAPSSALIGVRLDFTHYVTQAVRAVMRNAAIEKYVSGSANGRDIAAGFENGWLEITELNNHAAAAGTVDAVNDAIEGLLRGRIHVFSGEYTGVSPFDPDDRCDLRTEYVENAASSLASFHYVLDDVVIVER